LIIGVPSISESLRPDGGEPDPSDARSARLLDQKNGSSSLFKNNDQEFAEIAADPVRRAAAIADLAGSIKRLSHYANLATAGMILVAFATPQGAGALAACVVGFWAIVLNMDSNLRLLRVVDRLHGDSRIPASNEPLEHSPGKP
jgi:hypothetical protein